MELEEVKLTFTQEPDSCSPHDLVHALHVETDDAGAGPYLVLRTERWALDFEGVDAFAEMLRRVIGLRDGGLCTITSTKS